MERVHVFMLASGILLWSCVPASAQGRPTSDTPIGAWRGWSKCLVRPSGCVDEESVYRFSAIKDSTDRLRLSGSRIVKGSEVDMGDMACRYDARAHTIDCQVPKGGGGIHFELQGDSIGGTMTLANGTVWRTISLRRVATH